MQFPDLRRDGAPERTDDPRRHGLAQTERAADRDGHVADVHIRERPECERLQAGGALVRADDGRVDGLVNGSDGAGNGRPVVQLERDGA